MNKFTTVLILCLLLIWKNGLSQDTLRIVQVNEEIAKKIVIDLKKYDICKQEVKNLDSTVFFLQSKSVMQDTVIQLKDSQLEITEKQFKRVRKERNIAFGAVAILIILAVIQ